MMCSVTFTFFCRRDGVSGVLSESDDAAMSHLPAALEQADVSDAWTCVESMNDTHIERSDIRGVIIFLVRAAPGQGIVHCIAITGEQLEIVMRKYPEIRESRRA
jgi:hypothetical protein